MAAWLSGQPENLADEPYTVKLNVADLPDYLPANTFSGKYVNFDLSGSTITSIGGFGETGNYLTKITMPNTVTSIGQSAFQNCNGLTSITIGNKVTSIGNYAFAYLSSLTSVTFQGTITSSGFGNDAFTGLGDLRAKYLDATNGGIGTYTTTAPVGSSSVWTKQGSDTVFTFYSIDEFAMWLAYQSENTVDNPYNIKLIVSDLADINSVLITNSTRYVNLDFSGSTITADFGGDYFRDCTSLTSVTIPNGVTSIIDFYNCTNLTAINAAADNNAYSSQDGVLYNKDKSTLVMYPLGKTGAFTIPSSVTSIREWAFNYCASLTSITIPSSVTSIGDGAFSNCASLSAIVVAFDNSAYSSQDDVLYNKAKTVLIQYPAGKTGSTFTIPNSVTSIGYNAFYGCTSLTSVTIPNSVTSIGGNAFYGCTTLVSVKFEGTIAASYLNSYAFYGLGDLRAKYLANGEGTYKRPNTTSTTWTKQE